MSGSYKDLRVWHQPMELAELVYAATASFPRAEMFGLCNQLRRAAVSVPSNIAEGKGHRTGPEFGRFLFHARGSLLEVETQIEFARRVRYISDEGAAELLSQTGTVARSLNALINSVVGESTARAARTNS